MWPFVFAILLLLSALYLLSFRNLVYVLSSVMFAVLLVMLPDALMKYVLIDIFGAHPSILLYLLTVCAIIFAVYLCVEKSLKRNWFLNISLGMGLLAGLFVNAMRMIFAR